VHAIGTLGQSFRAHHGHGKACRGRDVRGLPAIDLARAESALKRGLCRRASSRAPPSQLATDAKASFKILMVRVRAGADAWLPAAEVLTRSRRPIFPIHGSDRRAKAADLRSRNSDHTPFSRPSLQALAWVEDIYELTTIRKDGSRFRGRWCSRSQEHCGRGANGKKKPKFIYYWLSLIATRQHRAPPCGQALLSGGTAKAR